jgi:hypothetical protein
MRAKNSNDLALLLKQLPTTDLKSRCLALRLSARFYTNNQVFFGFTTSEEYRVLRSGILANISQLDFQELTHIIYWLRIFKLDGLESLSQAESDALKTAITACCDDPNMEAKAAECLFDCSHCDIFIPELYAITLRRLESDVMAAKYFDVIQVLCSKALVKQELGERLVKACVNSVVRRPLNKATLVEVIRLFNCTTSLISGGLYPYGREVVETDAEGYQSEELWTLYKVLAQHTLERISSLSAQDCLEVMICYSFKLPHDYDLLRTVLHKLTSNFQRTPEQFSTNFFYVYAKYLKNIAVRNGFFPTIAELQVVLDISTEGTHAQRKTAELVRFVLASHPENSAQLSE